MDQKETMKKGLYPCIWLLNGKAMYGFKNTEVRAEDPVELARAFVEAGADGIVIFDLSRGDEDHDAAIDMIRKICEECPVPVIGAGNIRRMEDVKKLIYAGCDFAALNLSKESNRVLAREVCERFGKDRIAGCFKFGELTDSDWEKLLPWLSMRILLDADTIGISVLEGAGDALPCIACVRDRSVETLIEWLSHDSVTALSGFGMVRAAAAGEEVIRDIKEQIRGAGILLQNPDEKPPAAFAWADFRKGPDGLLPVVVQEESTGQVLMVAYMDEEAYRRTLETGRMTYFSRSRQSLWVKGETSGHFQYVRALYGDCDMDTLLARVVQIGPACHTGSHSCFFQKVQETGAAHMQAAAPQAAGMHAGLAAGDVLRQDYKTILDRRDNPREGSYTNYLFDKGLDKMLKKLGEENTEIIIAAKNPAENEIIYEIADYLYHLEVVMAQKGVDWDDITRELVRRQKKE